MREINIYQMNINPFMTDDLEEKRKNISKIIELNISPRGFYDRIGKVHMHSFRPKDNGGYGKYSDLRVEEIEEPTILVYNSLFDLDKNGSSAYSRLIYAMSNSCVKAVYFTDYSLERPFRINESETNKWVDDELGLIFRDTIGTRPNIRRAETPVKLIEAITNLRNENPPVLLGDIANELKINYALVRRYASKTTSSPGKGVPINVEQKKYLKSVYDEIRKEEYSRFEIRYETFL